VQQLKPRPLKYETIRDMDSFIEHVKKGSLKNCVVQGLDVAILCVDWSQVDTENTMFLGCKLESIEEETRLLRKGAQFFAPFVGLPYNPYRTELYTPYELMGGYDAVENNSLDIRINKHFDAHGGHDADIMEALSQRIHDYSIDSAIKELLGQDETTGLTTRKAVGIMGGHLATRDDPYYRKTVDLARLLTQAGYFIVGGGGPGIMEAANLGAYLATASDDSVEKSIAILSKSPKYAKDDGTMDPGYVGQAREVIAQYPNGADSLAIPTWFYGHEPVNLFATHIGKYFSNSIREDGLLAISIFGVVFAPGSAATTEEVFMDAAQNHYATFNYYSPMVFLGEGHYLQSQVYSCLAQQAVGHPYAQMITISDNPQKLVDFIKKHPPLCNDLPPT
jgi:predicted Rossmann-fold nucleotide-binding protein